MSVENGGGSTEDQRMADALRDAGQHVFAYLYETFGTPLYDYCEGLLQDSVAAGDAVQDSLVAVDARITGLPQPDQLRVALYSSARRQCLNQLPSHWGKQTTQPETPVDEFAWDIPEIDVPGAEGEKLAVTIAALARLPDRDREVLNLSFRHGIKGGDLAAVLGRSARRAQALLAAASVRFEQSAAVVVAVRAGRAGCAALDDLAGQQDPASIPLTSKLGQRLAGHVTACADCARSRRDRDFSPELISEVPLATPPVRLRLRINRTALALGDYRRTVVDRSDDPDDGGGLQMIQARAWRRPKTMAASSAALAVLAVPAFVFYRIELPRAPSPRPIPARVATGIQSPAATSTLQISPELHPSAPGLKHARRRHRQFPPLPGAHGSSPVGVLPSSGTAGSSPAPSGSTAPGPRHSHPPSLPPTTEPTTAPPSPTPTSGPTPTPSSSGD